MLESRHRKWCKKRALEEQRLFEMAKLRAQFGSILADVGLRSRGGGSASGMAGRCWADSCRWERRCVLRGVHAHRRLPWYSAMTCSHDRLQSAGRKRVGRELWTTTCRRGGRGCATADCILFLSFDLLRGRAGKAHVRALQRQQERERGRRVLALDFEQGASSGSEGGGSGDDAAGGGGSGRRRPKRRREADDDGVLLLFRSSND